MHAVRDDDTCLVYRHVDREREGEGEREREREMTSKCYLYRTKTRTKMRDHEVVGNRWYKYRCDSV